MIAAPAWAALEIGDELTVVKLAPNGREAARYPGTVTARHEPGSWVIVQAVWTHREIEIEGLTFSPGDVLLEWFSPLHEFNAFSVSSPGGRFRGWYVNATHPARLDISDGQPILFWHDLYLDIIALPDGRTFICDEDELRGSGLMQHDPGLYSRILQTRHDILDRIAQGAAPFTSGPHRAAQTANGRPE